MTIFTRWPLVVLIAVAAPLLSWHAARPQATDQFIRSAQWLDPIAGELRGPVVIQIAKGRIAKIVSAADFKPPAGAEVRDLGRATLLPGLIDGHVHLQIGGQPEQNAQTILRAGFTTVVDLGATSDAVLRLRDQINAGAVEGPRILAAGLWVGKQGGICEFGGIGLAGGPEAYRARVRENIAAGADLTKVCVSTWVAAAFQQPQAYEIDDAALAAAIDESHRARRIAIAHAISLGGVKAALAAKIDGLAHAAYVDEATAAELRTRGVFMEPTLASLIGAANGPAAQALRQSVAVAHAAGVRLVFGTDGGVLPHGQNAKEFAALVAAGVPLADAVRAATTNAAAAFGLGAETGQIKAGYAADLIAVDGDPLHDVDALSRVVFVMRNGRLVRQGPPSA